MVTFLAGAGAADGLVVNSTRQMGERRGTILRAIAVKASCMVNSYSIWPKAARVETTGCPFR